jgi:hypothetical protein
MVARGRDLTMIPSRASSGSSQVSQHLEHGKSEKPADSLAEHAHLSSNASVVYCPHLYC